MWRMLWVIVLHEAVAMFIHWVLKSWQKSILQNLSIHVGVHNSFKDTNLSSFIQTDPYPYMYLDRVFRMRFWLRSFTLFSTAEPFVRLQLHGCLIHSNIFFEVIFQVCVSPFQPLLFVCIENKLTIIKAEPLKGTALYLGGENRNGMAAVVSSSLCIIS